MPPRFLDTNILVHLLTRDDEAKAQKALSLLTRVERGEEKVMTSALVIFEVVFTVARRYKVPRGRVRELVMPVIALRGLQLPDRNLFCRALDLYAEKSISFADAYNVACMQAEEVAEIYSYDTDYDKVEGITRVEPE